MNLLNNLTLSRNWQVFIDTDKILWLALNRNDAPLNSLSKAILTELNDIIDKAGKAYTAGNIIGIGFISSKETGFIAGADINEFSGQNQQAIQEMIISVCRMLKKIEKIPTAVGVHGFCLGGGLELALACDYIVATNDASTKFGFPEVKLGILPGFGGSWRSIKKIGHFNAMNMMLTGRPISAKKAKHIGLVQKLVEDKHQLRWVMGNILRQQPKFKPAWKQRLAKTAAKLAIVRYFTIKYMLKSVAKKANPDHYPAPSAIVSLWSKCKNNIAAMELEEQRIFSTLMAGETAKQLQRLFLLGQSLKKQAGKEKINCHHVHVIGAGTMGGDIAAWCALKGMMVTLQDNNQQTLKAALKRAYALFAKRIPSEFAAAKLRLKADMAGEGIPQADVIIEAIVEDLKAKQEIFKNCEKLAKPQAILATNTSSIVIEKIAASLKSPERLIGLHFFNPVAKMPLIEVIQGKTSDPVNLQRGVAFALKISKSPLIVKSVPGFLINRVLIPYIAEAINRVQNGEKPEVIDAAAKAYDMPMGPIELADTVGLDICQNVIEIINPKAELPMCISEKLLKKHLGRKSGQGFYVWEKGKPIKKDVSGDVALGKELLQPLSIKCKEALKNSVVASDDLIDIGVILGTGFAPFRGGPITASRNKEL